MKFPTLYYIRHGQTEWNASGRVQGWRDIPLNDKGRAQAAQAGGILSELLARDGREASTLPHVASPLGRTRETMELVRASAGLPREGYALEARLREIGYGDWEGMTFAEMRTAHPAHYALRDADKWSVAAPNGESYAMLAARVREWLSALAGDTVVVAHGGTMRALMVTLGVASAAHALDQYIEQGVVYVFRDGKLAKYA